MIDNIADVFVVVISVVFIYFTIPFILFIEYIITSKILLLEKTLAFSDEKYHRNLEEIN